MKKLIFAILITSFVAGCASRLTVTGASLPEGEKRQPVSEEQVAIYLAAPEKALKVGTIQVVTSECKDQNLGAVELVFSELAKQAASMGANGVVLKTTEVDPKTGSETHLADAVFVPK